MARRRRGITGLAKLLESIPAESVESIVTSFADIANSEAASDGMGSIDFAGKSSRQEMTAKLDKVRNRKSGSTMIFYGTLAGPWVWLEEGVPRHEVGRRRSQVRNPAGNRLAVSTPQGPRANSHARFPRRGTWTRTVKEVERELTDVIEDVMDGMDL